MKPKLCATMLGVVRLWPYIAGGVSPCVAKCRIVGGHYI